MRFDRFHPTRRGLILTGSAGLLTAAAGPSFAAGSNALPGPSPVDTGKVEGGRVTFPNWRGEADRPSAPPPAPLPPAERVGFAVVGLGRLSLEEILPAFGECKRARPVALVSGSPEKARLVAAQHGIKPEAVYGYADFDRIAENREIQAVYIILPNGLHRDYVLRAAKARKHVLCEKPMATSTAEAREMTAACDAAGVRLMVAYRCQYEPYNREVIRLVRSGELGAVRFIEATNTQTMGTADQWRFRKALAGGGALPDIGLYCLNSARALLGEEPVEVFARITNPKDDPRYREVEESISFMLRFPSGAIANCASSYGAHESKDLRVRLEKGWIDLENAFAYEGQQMRLAHREGKTEAVESVRLSRENQFALEIDHMAACVAQGRTPHTPGSEGVQDHQVMEAIYRSAETGAPVSLPTVAARDATRGPEPDKG
ncbi:Gfo/Idh/MocA family protein [Azospirillum rugosum]|uniref:Dehydrogenase n=1 Tax=Azospirillum rugosum TaxID=416170 RepID=A0ABS4SVF6_9PROT|nr:Gfo/Idh/MocA family oxidoreductase [Azospirillum rugosum]MBP2296546.1 putative dehydrogenase [Azospirillum rugosum]MDQ0530054.1 putative dehydrogenase [Azospirillum rugosum]